jgi:hypothetical protein
MAVFSRWDAEAKMNGHISKRALYGSEPLAHFLASLEVGGVVDEAGARATLEHGSIYAIAQIDADEQRLMRFDEGGLLPADPAVYVGTGWLQEVPNTIPDIAAVVSKQVQALNDPVLWFHEPLLSEDESKKKEGDWRKLGSQLYCVHARSGGDERQIGELIRFFMLSWHFLGFVTDGLHEASAASELLAHASMVVVGAYDGESALVWQRTS